MGFERPNIQTALEEGRYNPRSMFAKSTLAAVAFAGLIAVAVFYTSGSPLFGAYSGDNVSESNRSARIEAFNSLEFLQVSRVAETDVPAAIEAMHLSPADQAKMRAAIGQTGGASSSADAHSNSSSPGKESSKPDMSAAPAAANHAPAVTSAALPSLSQARSGPQLTLAWVRLWDTDVEDGDVIRIDSADYSRTVTLTRRGMSFAVPVPAGGQIRITGVRDGDGGGITVGLASGSAQAVLPIMSVGQVLTLNVRTQ